MKKVWLLSFVMFAVVGLQAQNGDFSGMANASVMRSGLWAVNNNQAGLADIEVVEGGICYQNRFKLSETSTKSVAAAFATKTGNFGLSFNRYGYSLYSENNYGLAYARHLGNVVAVGLQFDYYDINQSDEYGNKGVFLLELGVITKVTDKLRLGAHLFNPTKSKMSEYNDERVNTSIRIGADYSFSQLVDLAIEVEKTMQTDLQVKLGIEYQLIKNLFMRTGFKTVPNEFCMGLGYTLRGFTFDMSFATHQYLPLSTQMSLKYAFVKRTN